MRLLELTILTVLACTSSMLKANDGWAGNGGDLAGDAGNIWFIGDEPVEYCVKTTPEFPLSQVEVENAIQSSLHDWVDFFKDYKLSETILGPGGTTGRFPDGKVRQLSLKFKQVASCIEDSSHQIRFLIGETSPKIDRFLAFHRDSIGAAVRGDYDHKTYRNGGDVWIKDLRLKTTGGPHNGQIMTWKTQPILFKHLLLHELGHVFGMRHNSVFAMAEDAASEILQAFQTNMNLFYRHYGAIESPYEKFIFSRGHKLHLNFFAGGLFGDPEGSTKGEQIPREIRTNLELSVTEFYKIFLKFGVDGLVKLVFESMDGATKFAPADLTGVVTRGIYRETKFPGVYTTYLGTDDKPFSWRHALESDRGYAAEWRGKFTIGNLVAPAIINQHSQLEIFIQETGKWWNPSVQ